MRFMLLLILGWGLKLTDLISAVLTAILVIITAYYARVTAKYLKVSREMAATMKQANQINFRPFVQIEGLQPNNITGMARRGPGNPSVGTAASSGFVVMLTPPGAEYLMYSLRNLGQVPARDIRHHSELYAVDVRGNQETIQLDQATFTNPETLFPSQTSNRQLLLGNSVVYRTAGRIDFLRLKLRITYSGMRDLDPNIYFYSTVLRIKPAPNPEALNRGIGGVGVEESDEGIVKSEDDAKTT